MDNYLLSKSFFRFKNFFFKEFPKLSYSRSGEDLLLDDLFHQKSSGFYVDVGAFHPVKYSNTFKFYLKGWRGINIDPNSDTMRLFKKIRPHDLNINKAVGETTGVLDYFMNSQDPSMNTVSADFARQAAQKYGLNTSEKRSVPADTLENIILQTGCDPLSVDFLNVDVEGYDEQVLRSNNWNTIRPKIVLVEINGGFGHVQQHNITQFLNEQRYTMIAYTCLNQDVGNGFFMANEII